MTSDDLPQDGFSPAFYGAISIGAPVAAFLFVWFTADRMSGSLLIQSFQPQWEVRLTAQEIILLIISCLIGFGFGRKGMLKGESRICIIGVVINLLLLLPLALALTDVLTAGEYF
ncbi:MAG TPA: hypothetical protein VFD58_07345 [Blastocatellia bacterium]|nr:hypothetical protein [Blastocatellia bacterium]